MSLLVLLAGIALFLNTSIAGFTGLQLAGLLLILFGLGKLAHVCGMCGSCESCCKK
jgi:hypothetical protein